MKTQTDAEVLYDFTVYSLQSQKLDRKIKQLTKIKEIIDIKAEQAFDVYEDRLKQRGEDIVLPDLKQDVDEALNT
jgi:hypothetical protein